MINFLRLLEGYINITQIYLVVFSDTLDFSCFSCSTSMLQVTRYGLGLKLHLGRNLPSIMSYTLLIQRIYHVNHFQEYKVLSGKNMYYIRRRKTNEQI